MEYRGRFSLNNQPITIQRYTGAYDNDGIYQRTLSETITAYGSMQPYKTIAPTEMFMPSRGENVEQKVILYLNMLLYMNDGTQNHETSDLVLMDGRTYKPVSVENWNYGKSNLSHYRYVLKVFDGY